MGSRAARVPGAARATWARASPQGWGLVGGRFPGEGPVQEAGWFKAWIAASSSFGLRFRAQRGLPGRLLPTRGAGDLQGRGISATRVLALPQPGSARNRRCGAGAAGPGPPRTPARGGWSPLGGERAGERGESLASCRRERPSSQSSGPEDRSLGTEVGRSGRVC